MVVQHAWALAREEITSALHTSFSGSLCVRKHQLTYPTAKTGKSKAGLGCQFQYSAHVTSHLIHAGLRVTARAHGSQTVV